MGATRVMAENRTDWRGTVMAVFQPGEETGQGARAMIEDGMVKRFAKPDVTLGQHVMPLSAGQIGWRTGTMRRIRAVLAEYTAKPNGGC